MQSQVLRRGSCRPLFALRFDRFWPVRPVGTAAVEIDLTTIGNDVAGRGPQDCSRLCGRPGAAAIARGRRRPARARRVYGVEKPVAGALTHGCRQRRGRIRARDAGHLIAMRRSRVHEHTTSAAWSAAGPGRAQSARTGFGVRCWGQDPRRARCRRPRLLAARPASRPRLSRRWFDIRGTAARCIGNSGPTDRADPWALFRRPLHIGARCVGQRIISGACKRTSIRVHHVAAVVMPSRSPARCRRGPEPRAGPGRTEEVRSIGGSGEVEPAHTASERRGPTRRLHERAFEIREPRIVWYALAGRTAAHRADPRSDSQAWRGPDSRRGITRQELGAIRRLTVLVVWRRTHALRTPHLQAERDQPDRGVADSSVERGEPSEDLNVFA
jgi:hypothetical protein